MSGFEIVGVVLGAIPLLISALENYKSGKSTVATFMKWQGQLDTLLFRLKSQKLAFFLDILELLRSADVDDVAENPNVTEAECLLILQHAKTGECLRDYLGQHYDMFMETLACKKAAPKKFNPTTFKLVVEIMDALQEAMVQTDTSSVSSRFIEAKTSQVTESVKSPAKLSVPSILDTHHRAVLAYTQNNPSTICAIASQTKPRGSMLNLGLDGNSLGPLDALPESTNVLGGSLSLAEVLQRGHDSEAVRMTYKEQTLLALDIACSLVQLCETPWLELPFTSHILTIIPMKKKHSNHTKAFIEQRYKPERATQVDLGPEAVLRELAILLLELWHHRTLDFWCMKEGGGMDITTPDGRLKAAISWLKATSERIPPYYIDAIEQSIGICCGRHRAWRDKEFLKIYCENVIIPLQESCRAWDVSEGCFYFLQDEQDALDR
ncbi:hypothetical protein PG984_005472 [Apiospora sp. TS-2023a]